MFPLCYQAKLTSFETLREESNWETLIQILDKADPERNDFQVHYFGHWTSPFEIVVLRPGSQAAAVAQKCADVLSEYPILDEEDYSRRESDAVWEECLHYVRGSDRVPSDVSDDELQTITSQVFSAVTQHDTRLPSRQDVETALEALGFEAAE